MVANRPVRMLIERHGPDADPMDIARRLRCSHRCGERPYSVAIIDDPSSTPGSFHHPVKQPPVPLIGEPYKKL